MNEPKKINEEMPFWLVLVGTMPFVCLSMGIAFNWYEDVTHSLNLLLNYAAIIFSFLGGVHWGLALTHQKINARVANYMLLESIFASLLAWGIMFVDVMYIRLLMFAFLYAMIWGIDSLLFTNKIIPLWFFTLRGVVTPIVVVAMYVAYFSII